MNASRTIIALETALGIWALLVLAVFFGIFLWRTFIEPQDPRPSLLHRLGQGLLPTGVFAAITLFLVVSPRWAAIYFVVWWTVLFAVLPFGVRTQAEAGEIVPGSAPSAPLAPRLKQKALATSVIAAIACFALWAFLAIWRN